MNQNDLKSVIETKRILTSGISVELVCHTLSSPGEVSLDRNSYILSKLLYIAPPKRMYLIEGALKRPVTVDGDTILLPPHMPLVSEQEAGIYHTIRCCFTPELFHTITEVPESGNFQRLETCFGLNDNRIDDAMMEMVEEIREPTYASDKLIEYRCMSLMIYLARKLTKEASLDRSVIGGLSSWQIKRIREYLKEVCGHPPSLKEIAKICGVSTGHLSRAFKNTTGITVHQFVERMQVKRAKAMLMDNKKSMGLPQIEWVD